MTAAAPAVDARLLDIDARIGFAHPLVRSAAYRSAADGNRHRVHRALAEATDPERDADRRAWHRARGTFGPDEAVAADLERSAGSAQARGGVAAAAAFLERAAALSPDPAKRARRSLAAAEAKQLAGAPHAAATLVAAAADGPLSPLERAHARRLQGQIALDMQRGREAVPLLLDAARRLETLDPGLASATYLMTLRAGSARRPPRSAACCGTQPSRPRTRRAAAGADTCRSTCSWPALAVRFTDGYVAARGGTEARPAGIACRRRPHARPALARFRPARGVRPVRRRDGPGAGHAQRRVDARSRRARVAPARAGLPGAVAHLRRASSTPRRRCSSEAEAIAEATALGRLRGRTADPRRVSRRRSRARRRSADMVAPLATARGEGVILTFGSTPAPWPTTAPGTTKRRCPRPSVRAGWTSSPSSVWTLPELVEAAARCGQDQLAAGALERLCERTPRGGDRMRARPRGALTRADDAGTCRRSALRAKRSSGSAAAASRPNRPAPICSTANGCAAKAGAWTRGSICGRRMTASARSGWPRSPSGPAASWKPPARPCANARSRPATN